MESEIIDALKKKNLSDSSISLYIKNIKRLSGLKEIKNLNFLNDKESILNKLNSYKDTTKRNYFIAIVSILASLKTINKKYNKLYKIYTEEMMKVDGLVKEEIKNGEKTITQKDNWIEWKDVIDKFNELKNEVSEFTNKKVISEGQYNKLLDYLILSLYVLLPPRRNEYKDMYIVKNYSESLPKTDNYYLTDSNEFIFNNYKTSKKYGVQQIKAPTELKDVINIFMKFHPLIKGKKIAKTSNIPLLVDFDGYHLNKINSITKILNRVFGKNIGASMLRHSYLSSKYGDIKEEQKEDAELMGHTVKQQEEYIKK